MTNLDSSDITAKASVRSLLVKLPATAGRNNNGRITSRHKEAGAKKLYRIIDFKRNKFGVEGTVATVEYDPRITSYNVCYTKLLRFAKHIQQFLIMFFWECQKELFWFDCIDNYIVITSYSIHYTKLYDYGCCKG